LNKKVKQLARKSALSLRAQQNQIVVVDELSFDAPKTKKMVELLNNLNISDKKALIILPVQNNFVLLSARNLEKAKVVTVNELNTYIIMNSNVLVMPEEAVKAIEGTFNA